MVLSTLSPKVARQGQLNPAAPHAPLSMGPSHTVTLSKLCMSDHDHQMHSTRFFLQLRSLSSRSSRFRVFYHRPAHVLHSIYRANIRM